MATKVNMPKQGLQMTEGNIIQWFYNEGDEVKDGEPLFEMETDKLTIEIDAPAGGTLLKIVRPAGDVVPITELIGVIGEPGEDITDILAEAGGDSAAPDQSEAPAAPSAPSAPAPAPAPAAQPAQPESRAGEATATATATSTSGRRFVTPRARMRAGEYGIDPEALDGSGPDGLVIERDVLAAKEAAPKVTPLARKVAEQEGVSLSDVSGSGPRGKITKADIQAAVRRPAGDVPAEDRVTPLSGMRRTIARRMRESLDTAAQAVHRMEVDMSEAVRLRTKLKAVDINVSYNDIILKATARALTEHPRMNAAFTEDGIIEYSAVNIGVAVALVDGLVVPVLRDVDLKPLQRIHEEAKVLAKRARDGELSPEEMSGGTFSVSNLGMYEIDSFTAIIDTPESGILAVGAIKDQVVARDGEMVIRPMSNLSLTYDHRMIDGAPAAGFLLTLKRTLENPYTML